MPTNPTDPARPRTVSGGLPLPPRQLPHPAAVPSHTGTSKIVAGITGTVVGAYGAIRRAAAERGIS